LTTTHCNLKQHKRRIPVSEPPKTFREVIDLTRQLGIRFLWIDSICTIQDSKEDWARESKMMGAIYERSYVTIAASSAIDGDFRLFPGDGLDTPSKYLEFPCDIASPEFGSVYLSHSTTDTMDPGTRLKQGPLNQRGWIFQERALSRRILHFLTSQMY
jgi:hypothetical protein